MSIRWSIANNALKCWAKSIHTLVQIGDNDIYFQLSKESLCLTTFDASLTASVECTFSRDFFVAYDIPGEDYIFRISSKCFLKAFNSPKFLTKSVNFVDFATTENSDKLDVTVNCKYQVDITYSINLNVDAEILRLDCDISLLTNMAKMEARSILHILSNFAQAKGVSDLTFKMTAEKIHFKNNTTNLTIKEGDVYTEISIKNEDLLEFKFEDSSCVLTYSMSAFKTFAIFADAMKLPVDIHFQKGTEPLMVKIKSEFHFEATLTLATRLFSTQQAMDAASAAGVSTTDHQNNEANSEQTNFSLSQPPNNNENINHGGGGRGGANPPAPNAAYDSDSDSETDDDDDDDGICIPYKRKPWPTDPVEIERVKKRRDELMSRFDFNHYNPDQGIELCPETP